MIMIMTMLIMMMIMLHIAECWSCGLKVNYYDTADDDHNDVYRYNDDNDDDDNF